MGGGVNSDGGGVFVGCGGSAGGVREGGSEGGDV